MTERYFYAVLETLEQDDEDHVYLDCISAETFDEMRRHGTLLKCSQQERVPYVGNILRVLRQDLPNALIDRVSQARSRIWLKTVVAEKGELPDIANISAEFVSLAAEGDNDVRPELNISLPEEADPIVQEQAEKLFRFSSKNASGLRSLFVDLLWLSHARQKHVVAYRIGQGNCNAIVDKHEHPLFFFDLGWPIQTNIYGAPRPAPDLLVIGSNAVYASPVILSHWDWDHWAYALKSWSYDHVSRAAKPQWKDDALDRPWLVPAPSKRLKLGPSHYKLIEELLRRAPGGRRALHLWPSGMDFYRFGDLIIFKCAPVRGRALDRNNSGLAAAVHISDGHQDGWVLLPGDAEFRSIPLQCTKAVITPENLVGLVASHHGGKLDVFSIPSTQVDGARLVISTGHNNYGHPNKQMLSNYEYQGWSDQVRTDALAPHCTSCEEPHHVGALVVQPEHFEKPKCSCARVPNARMSINHD